MTQTISLPLAAIVMASSLGEGQYVFHRESVLGTSLELKVTANTYATAQTAEARVLAEIQRESKILSGYDPASEFSRWVKTRGDRVPVSRDLFEVLSRFDRYRALTSGALDAAAEAVTQVWKSAAASNRLPAREELDAAVAAARGPQLVARSDPADRHALKPHTPDSEFVHQELHRRARSRCGAGPAWSEGLGGEYRRRPGGARSRNRNGEHHRSPRTMRKMPNPSPEYKYGTAPLPPAATTAGECKSAACSIRI